MLLPPTLHALNRRSNPDQQARRHLTWVGLLGMVSLLALAGCTSFSPAPLPPTQLQVPASWHADRSDPSKPLPAATLLAGWWQRFDDPLLVRLVEQALLNNGSVQGAQAALRQARALRDAAAAGLLPSVGSSASAQRGTQGGQSTGSSYRLGLDASWELDLFGARRSALDSSEASAQSRLASLGDVQVSIAAEVALVYIELRAAQARLEIAHANLSSQLETQQISSWRLQAGLVTTLDTEQARGATAQTQAQLPGLQASQMQSAHALAVLTGRPPAALLNELGAPAPVPQAPADLVLNLPAETLRQRPDVRVAELTVVGAWADLAQADAARAPSLKLGGSLGLSALTLGALGSGAAVVSSVLASVSMPIFDGGAGLARVRAQQAVLDQARSSYQAVVLTALKDVEDALVALRADRERLTRLQQAADAAGNAARLARQRYTSGLIDFRTVLETQRTQLSLQDSVAAASATVSANHVRLYKALGGGWLPDEPARTPR